MCFCEIHNCSFFLNDYQTKVVFLIVIVCRERREGLNLPPNFQKGGGLTRHEHNFWQEQRDGWHFSGGYRGDCLKRGTWTVCQYKRSLARKKGVMFLRGVDTPMHTMRVSFILFWCNFWVTDIVTDPLNVKYNEISLRLFISVMNKSISFVMAFISK